LAAPLKKEGLSCSLDFLVTFRFHDGREMFMRISGVFITSYLFRRQVNKNCHKVANIFYVHDHEKLISFANVKALFLEFNGSDLE